MSHDKHIRGYKYLAPVAMVFITVLLCDILLVYRLTSFWGITVSGGIFVMPLYYTMLDIIAEVYGYQYARQMIWLMLLCSAIFSGILSLINILPSPEGWVHQNLYHYQFAHLFRVALGGGFFALFFSAFANSYLLSKWKTLAKGKYYWARSVGSSAIGEFIQNFVGALVIFSGVLPFHKVLEIVMPLYIIQIVEGAILTIPASIVVYYLKRAENISHYDQHLSYNPFSLKLTS